jgi:deoxyribodipyrimidine photo-lyase
MQETAAGVRYERVLCWLRRDLRLRDHRALFEACARAKEVVLVFIYDAGILEKLPTRTDQRVAFIVDSLQKLDSEVREMGSALVTTYGDPRVEIPKLMAEIECNAVFLNEDYEPAAIARDAEVEKRLQKVSRSFEAFKDQVIFAKKEITKSDGSPYRVFTPYKKTWLGRLTKNEVQPYEPNLKKLLKISNFKTQPHVRTLDEIGFPGSTCAVNGGSAGARGELKKFLKKIDHYEQERDFPSLDSTSRLSVHLRFGTISVRECVRNCWQNPSKGASVWLSELIWRDFYQMILAWFPSVTDQAFLAKYADIRWPGEEKNFQAWCEGRTGFPIVDAAMRQINQTGWMHNRLRMVVASFLVKDLLIDWRRGEKYFADQLIDFDLAANNGGWQWCASTGCDAQPYFRIFNPVSQSERFDKDGDFIRKFVPELAGFSGKDIHFPLSSRAKKLPPGFQLGKSYPQPIVEHSVQRDKALLLFKLQKGP